MRARSVVKFFFLRLHSALVTLRDARTCAATRLVFERCTGTVEASMNVTIRDVAKATGVSTATVSNVLNKTGKVGADTRRLVLGAVKRLGYIPDVHARNLASRDRRTLGIIVSDIENPFFPEVVKGFETRARQLGYDVILSDTNYDPRRTREAADRMMEHKVRGVAVMTSEISTQAHSSTRAPEDRRHLPRSCTRQEIHEQSRASIMLPACARSSSILYSARTSSALPLSQEAPASNRTSLRLEAYQNACAIWASILVPILTGDLRFEGGLAAGGTHRKDVSRSHRGRCGERPHRRRRDERDS